MVNRSEIKSIFESFAVTEKIVKDLKHYVSATIFGQGFSIIRSIFIPILFSPSQLGIWNLFNVLLGYFANAHLGLLHGMNKEIPYLREKKDYKNIDPKDHKNGWNVPAMVSYDHQEVEAKSIDLWEEHNREIGHHFNLSIDLTSCTGCGSCVVACHAENNVPVVGKNEVRVGRDMHWLRIDRYYSSDVTKHSAQADGLLETKKMYIDMENPSANPKVTFQPMMCQHCGQASSNIEGFKPLEIKP